MLEEMNEPIYAVENILCWRRWKTKNEYVREFLMLWAGYSLEEATWELEDSLPYKEALYKVLNSGRIAEGN